MRILLVHNRYRSGTPSGENRVVDQEGEALVVQLGRLGAAGRSRLGNDPQGTGRWEARPRLQHHLRPHQRGRSVEEACTLL